MEQFREMLFEEREPNLNNIPKRINGLSASTLLPSPGNTVLTNSLQTRNDSSPNKWKTSLLGAVGS